MANALTPQTPLYEPDHLAVGWARELTAALSRGVPLHGAYLHGSAALGGFIAGKSDIDLLFVVPEPMTATQKRSAISRLTAWPGCPGSGIETTLLTRAQALDPTSGAFELHVCTGPGAKTVDGAGHPGDSDLALHAVVARAAAIALAGPTAATVFGEVPHPVAVDRLGGELRWALTNASRAYAVLNACRAALWVQSAHVLSKCAAGEQSRHVFPAHRQEIEVALAEQRAGISTPPGAGTTAFVHDVLALLRHP